jgi:hypothetical protein
MNNDVLITFEILFVVDAPLLFLYMKSTWPLRTNILCLVSIPVLWYLTYSPLHELSHIAGTYMVGGTVTYYKLIPRFWLGEFGHAWITTEGMTGMWRQLVSTASPYIGDLVCTIAGLFFLRRGFSKNPFLVGFLFMVLCLRPAFDVVCEAIALILGNQGDLFVIKNVIGSFLTWLCIILFLATSLYSILKILKRHVGFPGTPIDIPVNS